MQTEKMQKRVEIQTKQTVRTDTGAFSHTWVTDKTVWAYIAPITGKELYAGEQVQAEVTHEITIQYDACPTLTPANRIKYKTRFFDINVTKNIDERNEFWVMRCKEVV